MTLAEFLEGASQAERVVGPELAAAGPGGAIADQLAKLALAAGAAAAQAGRDPVAHVTRLLAVDPELAQVEHELDAVEDAKFGSEAPDTLPDIYPELDED